MIQVEVNPPTNDLAPFKEIEILECFYVEDPRCIWIRVPDHLSPKDPQRMLNAILLKDMTAAVFQPDMKVHRLVTKLSVFPWEPPQTVSVEKTE